MVTTLPLISLSRRPSSTGPQPSAGVSRRLVEPRPALPLTDPRKRLLRQSPHPVLGPCSLTVGGLETLSGGGT